MHGEMLNMVIDQENVIPLFADIESIAPFSSNFCCHDWNTPSSVKFWSFAGELFLFSPLLRLCGSHCSEGDTICLGLGLLSFSVLDTVWIPPPPRDTSLRSPKRCPRVMWLVRPSFHVSSLSRMLLLGLWTFLSASLIFFCFLTFFLFLFALLPLKFLRFLILLLNFSLLLWCHLSRDFFSL